ncbi:hypothetical protein C1645_732253 [Glomus cerebriforme]|uniref:Uncharacterized protein n=1 Tax=Glomus cerebriforme TaxID=658196 RepID=A0A397TLB2_9GLOM|nr:hypothetical protein C1645_732253 [Glomus cerebriforme]
METFIDKGFNNDYLEATYIAIFAHLVVWATCLLFSEFVRRRRPLLLPGLVGTLVEPQHDGIPETFTVPIFADIMVERYVKSANAAKDSLLMIVIATLAIQTGYGATAIWTYFFNELKEKGRENYC